MGFVCASDGFGQKDASSQVKNSKSQFSTIFSRKMEENVWCSSLCFQAIHSYLGVSFFA